MELETQKQKRGGVLSRFANGPSGVQAFGLFWLAVSTSCSSWEIEPRDPTPRSVAVPGTGVFRWTAERGWTQPDRGDWGELDHVWAEARRAYDAKSYADALAGFLVLEERLSGTTAYKELNYFMGECYYQLGDYENALEHYRRVYRTDLPSPDFVDEARRRVFEIGMAYLQKKAACGFLGIVSYSCPEYGIEILDDLINENPELQYADDAQIEAARFYFEEGEYPESVPLYDRVSANSDSRWRDLAEYQAALAVYMQIRGVDYDQSVIQEAERRLSAYLEHHPRGAYAQNVREKLREISEMKGAQNLRIAKFYLREGEPRACEIYLRRVIRQHPDSAAAREARNIQKQLARSGESW